MKETKDQIGVVHSTFTIERNYAASSERVFEAFRDPAIKRRWFCEGEGWTVDEFSVDFRVGGKETSRFRTKQGPTMGNDSVYMDIAPGRRIVMAYTMTFGDTRISASLATFELEPNGGGTKVRFTEQAAFFPGSDGPERRRAGWNELLGHLEAELLRADA